MELKLYALQKCQQQKKSHRGKESMNTKLTINDNEEIDKYERKYIFEARNLAMLNKNNYNQNLSF